MPYYSQSKFAELHEVSAQAVSKAVGEGRVVKSAKGIDPSHPTNLYFVDKLKDNPRLKGMKAQKEEKDELDKLIEEKQSAPVPAAKSKVGRPKKPKGQSPGRKAIQVTEEYIENFSVDEIKADITALTKQSVDKLKVIEQVKALQLKTEERKQSLVPRALVQRVLGKMYSIDINEMRTLPDKLSSDLAALCKIEDTEIIFAMNKLIEKEVYKILEHQKRLLNDFLTGIKAEGIE